MTPTTDAVLAQLSLDAYSDIPVALPPNFFALDPSNFSLPLAPGESFANGIFHSGNAAALLTTSVIEGVNSLVIAFRGSDDTMDSQQDLNNINLSYVQFASLIDAVDKAAQASGLQVVVTGHSLGGAMAQLYMANHPDQPGGPGHEAVTFGSPGALMPSGMDERTINYAIADDPAMVLGAHRAEIGAALRADPALANLAADRIAQDLPGLTREQALASLPNLALDYDNRGNIVLLPGADGRLDSGADLANLARLDETRHAPELYASEVAAAVTSGQTVLVPEAPTTDPELHLLQAIYDGSGQDPAAHQAVLDQLLRSWADDVTGGLSDLGNDIFTQTRNDLAGIGEDLQLI